MLPVNAIWIGSKLGSLHAACLSSFRAVGHPVRLHCYAPPSDLPGDVETFDARRLLPEESLIRYKKSGSYSLFSNIYRLKILEAELGLYADCDVFCLKEIEDADYIFGWESDSYINGAVLKIPRNSEMLTAFLSATSDRSFVPPWLKPARRRIMRLRKAFGFPVSIDKLPWGTLGPRATTYFARKAGVADCAAPTDVFYPVSCDRVRSLLDPHLSLDDLITKRTLCVHLYNQALERHSASVPSGSPLAQILRNAGVCEAA